MQDIILLKDKELCVSENKAMDVNIITELYPNEDGLMVMHKFYDFVQGCDITKDELLQHLTLYHEKPYNETIDYFADNILHILGFIDQHHKLDKVLKALFDQIRNNVIEIMKEAGALQE